MFIKRAHLVFIIILCSIIVLNIGVKSCIGRNRNTKVGSSIPEWSLPAPSNLVATPVSYSQIDLSWIDNSNNEDGFEIERSTSSATDYSLLATVNANATSYSDTGLTPFTMYYYRVRAFNTIGDTSDWSNEIVANTLSPIWSRIECGIFYSLALTTNGLLWSWGYNEFGQLGLGDTINRYRPSFVTEDFSYNTFEGIASIAGSASHSLARKTDGTLWGWGANGFGQLGTGDTQGSDWPYPIGTASDWVDIVAGYGHTLGRKTDGQIYSWGYNLVGQLGLGDLTDRTTSTQIGTASDWVEVTVGIWHSFGRKTNGTLWAWGGNDNGRLGLGDLTDRTTPTQIGTDSDWTEASGGYKHSLGRKTNGSIYSWGNNMVGQLGLGDTIDRTTPTQIGTTSDWAEVAPGSWHSLARKTNGTIYSWGHNLYGQLGLGNNISMITPTQIGIDSDWAAMSGGDVHSLGLKTNGTIYSWGDNPYGQLGLGDTINRYIPWPLLGSFTDLSPPSYPSSLTTTVVSSTRIDLSWWDNSYNEEGFKIERKIGLTGTYEQITTVGSNVISYSNTGLTPNITYYYRVKSYNSYGESLYSNEASATPTVFAPSSLSAAVISSICIDLSWQDNSSDEDGFSIERKIGENGTYGEINTVNAGITSYSDISASGFAYNTYYYQIRAYYASGYSEYSNETYAVISYWEQMAPGESHTIGRKTNNTLWSWGRNNNGQLGLGDSGAGTNRITPTQIGTISDWSTIAAGSSHSIALKNNGTIWTWGSNSSGQLGDGTLTKRLTPRQIGTNSDWALVKGGYWHTIALKTDGAIWSWGYNGEGELGVSDTADRTTPTQIGTETDWSTIAVGSWNTIARKTNGTIWSWGYNYNGELGLGDTTDRNSPTQIGTNSDWIIIAAGGDGTGGHSLAIKNNGQIYSWGYNYYHQLGLGDTGLYGTNRNTPTQIGIASDWTEIVGGGKHSIGRKTNGTIYSWGYNEFGQLGLGDSGSFTYRIIPTQTGTDANWDSVFAGGNHTLGGKIGGTIWSWGNNSFGQLGLGDMINRNIPTLVGE